MTPARAITLDTRASHVRLLTLILLGGLLLVLVSPGVTRDAAAANVTLGATATVITDVLNVRSAPGTGNAIVDQLKTSPRREIIEEALESRGGVLVAQSTGEALAASNAFAPEHLLIATEDAEEMLGRIRGAGTVFVGATSSVAFGDYMTGANHVLPTGGMARGYSGLSTLDFVRWTTIQRVSPAAASRLALDTAILAEAEGLPGHAAAARFWSAP